MNIVLGKNGCGKSTMLRAVEQWMSGKAGNYGKTKYITPERGGKLAYNPNMESNILSSPAWLSGDRRKNQTYGFREQTVSQYKNLELSILREHAAFEPYIAQINSLLDNIEIKPVGTSFKIFQKGTTQEITADSISSGESELISLGIECLVFKTECVAGLENVLFLDEPDVHLHPDLQVRLMRFLKELAETNGFTVIIATHSTAILGALESYAKTHLALMTADLKEIHFKAISETYRKVLPVFGAHPLSNIFNEAPILLVEGEDDERIWQQVVRSSRGTIRVYPCSVDGITNLSDFEAESKILIQTVYEHARGYSLRDRDEGDENIDDLHPLIRMRLSCRNSENLLLSDEVLELLGKTWKEVKEGINKWLSVYQTHPHYEAMRAFKDSDFDRKNSNVKVVRMDLMGIIGSDKPWEVAVGQSIARLRASAKTNYDEEGKLLSYLGRKVVENLIPKLE